MNGQPSGAAPVRVLHVLGRTDRGGAESRIMDLYRAMDRDRVQFDFLVHCDAAAAGKGVTASEELMRVREPEDYDEEILSLGGRIYALPRLSLGIGGTGLSSYRSACGRFFREHRGVWRVVQGHMTSTAALYLDAAKRNGVPLTVAHARSAGTDPGLKGLLTRLLRRPLSQAGRRVGTPEGARAAVDVRFACSPEAAAAVFGRAPARILPNAVHVDGFRFDPEARERLRRELGLSGCRVVGHVGSFRYAKNHGFLLRAFDALRRREGGKSLRLLLVGDGGLFQQTRELAETMGLGASVLFAGKQERVGDYYQAMDVFAFPSRYEGLPGSVVEAQAAGLPCLISDRITETVDVTPLVRREAIGDDRAGTAERAAEGWTQALWERLADAPWEGAARESASAEAREALKRADFDVEGQARRLMDFYTGECCGS